MRRWTTDPQAGAATSASDNRAARPLPLGDRDAMGALFEAHGAQLRAVALRYTRDPDSAADVLQNASEKILRNGHQFRGGAKVSTWMYRVVANEALMWLRAERRRHARFVVGDGADLEWAPDPAPSSAEVVENRAEAERLGAAISALASNERDVIEACALRDESYAEWGRARGLRPGAAKSRAFRARRRLRELLT